MKTKFLSQSRPISNGIRKPLFFGLVISSLFITQSCNNQDDMSPVQANEVVAKTHLSSNSSKVTFVNGMLSFEDSKYFKSLIVLDDKNDEKIIKEIEKTAGFTSLNAIYEEALKQSNILAGQQQLPKIVTDNPDSFIINSNQTYEQNMFDSPIKRLINKDGMVKVGKSIYQFTKNKVKLLVDENKDLALLKKTNITDKNNKIYIGEVNVKPIESQKAKISNYYSNDWRRMEIGTLGMNDNRNLIAKMEYWTYLFPVYDYWTDQFLGYDPISYFKGAISWAKYYEDGKYAEKAFMDGWKLILKKIPGASILAGWVSPDMTHWSLQGVTANHLSINYNVNVGNGYTNQNFSGNIYQQNTQSIEFYLNVPQNSTSQPNAFFIFNASMSVSGSETINSQNRSINFSFSY